MSKKRWLFAGTLVCVMVAVAAVATGAFGLSNAQPADKAFGAASTTQKFSPDTDVPLLTATVKNSKPTDMILQVSMECSILTDNVINGGSDKPTESATTEGKVRAWITIDGKIVPVISSSTPPQDPAAQQSGDKDKDSVTFCNRVFNRTVADREGNTPDDGIDYSRDYIETKDANSFNWLRLNMGSGTHTIVLHGELTGSAAGTATTGQCGGFVVGATPSASCASAYVGNRSMIGEPTKLANNADLDGNITP